jgi:hypothetical protein
MMSFLTPMVGPSNQTIGVFGTHLSATSLNKIVEPMAAIDESWLQYIPVKPFFF